jgi:nitrate reductase assembly molybdenum cofactor insertion protein NarJ
MPVMTRYERLADLFDYPGPDYPRRVSAARDLLAARYPEAAARLETFARALPPGDGTLSEEELHEVQEIFTRSFDVQPITTLGVGYVMFGDDYKRGEVLVNLSREHREAGVDCGTELPDHLPTVLRLLARWQDLELAAEFVQELLHPALEMMIGEFEPNHMKERNRLYQKHFKTLIASSAERATIYREPLLALLSVLREDFALSELEKPVQVSDFLSSIGRELDIEASEGRRTRSSSAASWRSMP